MLGRSPYAALALYCTLVRLQRLWDSNRGWALLIGGDAEFCSKLTLSHALGFSFKRLLWLQLLRLCLCSRVHLLGRHTFTCP